jgi:hypothetical protein
MEPGFVQRVVRDTIEPLLAALYHLYPIDEENFNTILE